MDFRALFESSDIVKESWVILWERWKKHSSAGSAAPAMKPGQWHVNMNGIRTVLWSW